ILYCPRRCDGLFHPVRELAAGANLKPLRTVRSGLSKESIKVDSARRALLLLRSDRHGASSRGLETEAHHRLVHRADLLDVESPIRDALAVQDEKFVEHPVYGAVRDKRRHDASARLAGALIRSPFKERKAVG